MLKCVDEFVPTIRPDDPKYAVRMHGLETMKQGLATTVGGCLQTLTERDIYTTAELLRLVGYLQETFPSIIPHLPADSQQETRVRLEKMAHDPAMKDLQPAIGKLLETVKTSQAPE
jgi:hypothetical protein